MAGTFLAAPGLGRLPEKAERSCSRLNSRRDLLQNPIGTLVGTTAIAAKCEDVSLSESLGIGTRGVLIAPSIRCRASHCTITADVCHKFSSWAAGAPRELRAASSLEPGREENRSKMLTSKAQTDSVQTRPCAFSSPQSGR